MPGDRPAARPGDGSPAAGRSAAGSPVHDGALVERYERVDGRVFLTGVQALVRLPLEQMRRDRQQGWRTRGFVTGYPGSPLGGYDIALHRARDVLEAHGVQHLPGQNEELAMTTLMGTQMLDEHPHPDVDGVVAYWYGKGPGVDRSGDALKHGNFAGTSARGAVVILSGEDHEAKSSTVPYQQEHAFEHHGIPVLYPGSVAEIIELGLHAAALSRYSGCWVAMKLVGPLCDGGEVVRLSSDPPPVVLPELHFDGRQFRKSANFRFFPVVNIETERQLYEERHAAVLAYAGANGLNRVMLEGAGDRIGILAAGKTFGDVRQALEDLGFGDRELREAGIRLGKVGLVYPLDPDFVSRFARGLETVVVIEDKRDFLERQVAQALCGTGAVRVLGKRDEDGRRLFPVHGGMDSDVVARHLGDLFARWGLLAATGRGRLEEIARAAHGEAPALPRRTLNFCSGCPHNWSTPLAPGQVAWGAPGCHIIAAVMERPERRIEAVTQLGGEGLPWIGLAPYCSRPHVVQNLGDGALFHSSYQNIRFAVAAGVNITFRILYNGVIANTGGQSPVGAPKLETLLSHLALESVASIVLVTRTPERYRSSRLPARVLIRGVDALESSLRELAGIAGTTVLVYDGECANERRRRQKRGLLPPPSRFTVVNEDVCENCGDCGRIANCMSLQKAGTSLGQKTRIHQPSCNQDQACLRGECPSFVTVEASAGVVLKRSPRPRIDASDLPQVVPPSLSRPCHVLLPGLGGTGVLTANAILATAASLDGNEVRSYDQTGAAQKWGPVLSSLIVSAPGEPALTNRVGVAKADLYLALDLFAAVDRRNLDCCKAGVTRAVINRGLLPTGEMIRDPHVEVPVDRMVAAIGAATGDAVVVDARAIAEGLLGDHLLANMVAIGVAYQCRLLPISARAIEEAIRINGVQTEANILAFRAGRMHVHDPGRLAEMIGRPAGAFADRLADGGDARARAGLPQIDAMMRDTPAFATLPETFAVRLRLLAADLVAYQGGAYARRYLRVVEQAAVAGREVFGEDGGIDVARAVADNLHRLMAYKDEYEVARLLTCPAFVRRVGEAFTGPVRIHYNLQPPLLRNLGLRRKVRVGPWTRPLLATLARLRFLRGTWLDPFRFQAIRRRERALISWYSGLVELCLDRLRPGTVELVVELLSVPQAIRGYEHVKAESIDLAMRRAEELVEVLFGDRLPGGRRERRDATVAI